MTIQQLKCFAVMADTLHYTKAAKQLHISQPSLSYSISELEKELGLPLFERKDNKTCLTKYGEELLLSVRDALDAVNAVKAKACELLDPFSGVINLGNIYSISFDFVPQILERFYQNKDNGHITVNSFQGSTKVLTDKMLEGSLDLSLADLPDREQVASAYVFSQELKLIVPEGHRLSGLDQVRLHDLKDERLISLGENTSIIPHLTRCFAARGMEPNFVLSVAECSAMGAFISSNMGIAISPIVPALNSDRVRIIQFVEEDRILLDRKIYLHWVKGHYLTPEVKRFRDFILDQFAEPEDKRKEDSALVG